MLDAPVSGGEAGAIAGTLTIMVASGKAAFESVLPLFEAMGGKTTHIDEKAGAGQVAKACNQIITGVGWRRWQRPLQLRPQEWRRSCRGSPGAAGRPGQQPHPEHHGQRMVDRTAPGFKSWMHLADMRIVLQRGPSRRRFPLPSAPRPAQPTRRCRQWAYEEDSVAMLQALRGDDGGSDDMGRNESRFVGLGAMGRPMAENLLRAGFAVSVRARRPEVQRRWWRGACKARDWRQWRRSVRCRSLMVTNSGDIEALLLADGVLAGIAARWWFMWMSTIAPDSARKLAQACRNKAVDFLDAPVSSGVAGRATGRWRSWWVATGPRSRGCDRFEAMGKDHPCGSWPSGAGQVARPATR